MLYPQNTCSFTFFKVDFILTSAIDPVSQKTFLNNVREKIIHIIAYTAVEISI